MTIRPAVEAIPKSTGIDYLKEYYSSNAPFYTGSYFESLESYNNPENRITASDLYAVGTLNTPIRRKAAMGILITEADEIDALLSQVTGRKLSTLSKEERDEHLGPDSAAQKLYVALRRKNKPSEEKWQVSPTRASKIMARKRPHLIPINDRIIKNAIEKKTKDNDWKLWWEALTEDDYLEDRAETLRQAIDRPRLSTLRVLDVLLWMSGTKGNNTK